MASSLWSLRIVLVLTILTHPSAHAGVDYYVAPNLADCPVNVSCSTLNQYANSTTLHLTDSAFHFMPGTHLLQQIWIVGNASHLTLGGSFAPMMEQEGQKVIIDCGGIPGRGIRVENVETYLLETWR